MSKKDKNIILVISLLVIIIAILIDLFVLPKLFINVIGWFGFTISFKQSFLTLLFIKFIMYWNNMIFNLSK